MTRQQRLQAPDKYRQRCSYGAAPAPAPSVATARAHTSLSTYRHSLWVPALRTRRAAPGGGKAWKYIAAALSQKYLTAFARHV